MSCLIAVRRQTTKQRQSLQEQLRVSQKEQAIMQLSSAQEQAQQ